MQVEFTPIPGVCYAFDYPKLFSDIRSGELSKEEVRSLYRRLCREDSFFLLYFVLHYTTANHPFVVQCCKDADQDGNEDWIIDLWARGHFKALALDTPVPTPTGFKLHGDLAPGDTIYGGDGLPTQVVAKTEVFHNADCFEVTLSDGYVFTCSGQHLWKVNIPSRARLSGNKRAEWKTEVINTSSLKKEVDKSINTKTRKYPTIDMFYEDFTVYDDNQRVAFENFSENKRYLIEYQDNDNVYVYKPTKQDLIKIMEENLKEKYCL